MFYVVAPAFVVVFVVVTFSTVSIRDYMSLNGRAIDK
jgi:hypothetical protein